MRRPSHVYRVNATINYHYRLVTDGDGGAGADGVPNANANIHHRHRRPRCSHCFCLIFPGVLIYSF